MESDTLTVRHHKPAGDHKAHRNSRAQRHSKHKAEKTHKRATKEVSPWNSQ